MTIKRDLHDPTIDHDDLIIDAETITQWVDKTLSTPHAASVDSLAAKFPCLNDYGEDAEKINQLAQNSFKADIDAPADTLARVLKAIKEDADNNTPPLTASPTDNSPSASLYSSADSTPEAPETVFHRDFFLEFPKTKKKIAYLWPIAALFFLMALVGSIIHHEHVKSSALAIATSDIIDSDAPPIKKTRKAVAMTPDSDRHSQSNSQEHLATYNLKHEGENTHPEKKDDKDKDSQEDAEKDTGKERQQSVSR